MPFSLFSKTESPSSSSSAEEPLSSRLPSWDNSTILIKHASARRKATECFGAVSTGHGAKLVTKTPHIGDFIPAEKQIRSGEDHAYKGTRMREKQKILEGELRNREVKPTRYTREERSEAFQRGLEMAMNGDEARRF